MSFSTGSPEATKEQIEAIAQFKENNPSVVQIGNWGYYSDGTVILDFYWSFDENQERCWIYFNQKGEKIFN